MNIVPPGSVSTGDSATVAPKSKTAVDYESFLKLLVAQMKNQDPTAPMESTDYVAQLATFSQVEQSVQIKSKLEEILQASSLSQATAMIGKHITSADGLQAGIVSEVRVGSDAVVAKLVGGDEITIGPGVVIKNPA